MIQNNVRKLLDIVGDQDKCKACLAEIWWVKNPKTGKRMPITAEALNHFADCPHANRFRKKKVDESRAEG